MCRNIFNDKIRKQEKLSFRMTTFEDVLKYFKLRNIWSKFQHSAKRKF